MRVWLGDDELDAGPPQQAQLFSVLLARAGRPTTADELVDVLWGDAPPASALNTIHKYIGALRHILEPGLPPRRDGAYLQRRGNSYVFINSDAWLDLIAFHESLAAARVAAAEQRHEQALQSYVEGLDLWTGSAGDGLDIGQTSASIFAVLNAEFVDCVVAATAVAISLREPERVLRLLRMAAEIRPLHEPVWSSLVAALGASGRRAEALAAFHEIRVRLVEDLGIDPGPALTAAHQRVLNPPTDPVLEGEQQPEEDRAVAAEPYRIADFSGRLAEIKAIRSFVDHKARQQRTASVLLITGPPGVGKTTTALEALRDADTAGSRLFVNLHGFDVAPLTPLHVLRALLGQVNKGEAPPTSLDEASEAWLSAAASASFVVVLDNASSESQVRPVLGVDAPITVIVTSRRTLPGLESTTRIALGPLPRVESETFLETLIPESRRVHADLATLAEMCGDLPLALRIAGARIASRPQGSVGDFVDRLRDERNRLHQLVAGDLAVETAFSLSYNALPNATRLLFRSLALVHGSTFAARMVAAIDDLDTDACRDQLDELHDLGLVEVVHGNRYRMHDLIRLYAADRLRGETPAHEVRDQQVRLDRWILDTTAAAARTFPSTLALVPEVNSASEESMRDAEEWLTLESENWFGSLKSAAELGEHRLVVDATMALAGIADQWVDWPDWRGVHTLGFESALILDDQDAYVTQLMSAAGVIPDEDPAPGEFEPAARRALAAAEKLGNPRWIGWGWHTLSWALFEDSDITGTGHAANMATSEFAKTGDLGGQLMARSWALRTLVVLDAEEALIEAEALIAVIDGLGPHPERVLQTGTILDTFTAASRLFLSVRRFDQSLALSTRMLALKEPFLTHGRNKAIALHHRGLALVGLKQFDEAKIALESAQAYAGSYMPEFWTAAILNGLNTIATHTSKLPVAVHKSSTDPA